MPNVPRRQIFLSAGHPLGGGAAVPELRENPYNALVASLTVGRLRRAGYAAWLVPLTTVPYPHDIHAKTAWINARALPGDLAIDVHLDIAEPGCAAYAIEGPDTLALAQLLAEHVAQGTGLRCRGGMPETETAAGRLAFLHLVTCRAVLIELCSINTSDLAFALSSHAKERFAEALAAGAIEACLL